MEKCRLEGCIEEVISPSFRYCSNEHRRRVQYLKMKDKGYWAVRYQKKKRQWEKSDSGKKAGVPIRDWLRLPDEWK